MITPKTNFSDFNDTARYNFVWNIILTGAIISLLLGINSFFNNKSLFELYVYIFIAGSITTFLLWRFKEHYRLLAAFLFSFIYLTVIYSIFSIDSIETHVQGVSWMIMIIIVTFFMFGNKWGFILLFLMITIYSTYYLFFMEKFLTLSNYYLHSELTQKMLITKSVELSCAMFIIGYTMYQYEKVNDHLYLNAVDAIKNLKQEKEIVEKHNREKTALIQEVHHRVKNNLQVIVSLLRIQSSKLTTKEAKLSFQDAINRVLSMSLIHQKMYEDNSLVDLDIENYLNVLLKELIYATAKNEITYRIKSEIKSISAKNVVPFGLIINELVSNTIKHAFDDFEGDMKIEIELSEKENENEFKMTYFDNGKWKVNKNHSFGIQLIEIFVEQMDGIYKRSVQNDGTLYVFILKKGD